MSLSKKKSRKISVDQNEYRWSPSEDSGYMILVVQTISGKGKKLEIVISDDENVVVENGSYSIEVSETGKLIITPKLVESLIRDSIEMGWEPLKMGPPVQLSLNEGELQIRRGI